MTLRYSLLSTVLFAAMVMILVPASDAGRGPTNGPLPDNYIKFEEEEIGMEGAAKSWNGITVTLSDWVRKEGEECTGFTCASVGGPVAYYIVKRGREVSYGTHATWLAPESQKIPAISHIIFVLGDNLDSNVITSEDKTWGKIKGLYR